MDELDRQLTDPSFFATGDPHASLRRLRVEDPVHWTQGALSRGFWSVTRYADVMAVAIDPRTFSSERGGVTLPSSPQMEQISPQAMGCGESMIMTDPARHIAMRKAFNRLFLPRAVAVHEASGRKLVAEILDEVLPRGECDLVVDVAVKLPMAFICEMMGIPRKDWVRMNTWGNMVAGAEDPEYQVGSALDTRREGNSSIFKYCAQLSLERRGGAGDDLLSIIGNAEVQGRELNWRELGHNGGLFVLGGLETTRNAISGGVLALIENPREVDRLRSAPSLMHPACEEILRWTSPITQLMRIATRHVELRGKKIREGDRVVMWHASANRDEDAFADPDRFDVSRSPNEHLAFGRGEHFCIGAHLARLELRLMLEAVLREMPDLRLAGDVERLRSNVVAGIKHMPVRFSPRRAAAA
ncbi:MAG TPA: cytochrome P450 [Candidatus Binataceae bacterium]|nr:cytochrome P450 [Candidatus Binataceae bacterium]